VSAQRFSPYNQSNRPNSNPSSPATPSIRTNLESWGGDSFSSSSSRGNVQLPPLSCVNLDRLPPHRRTSEGTSSNSVPSATRSRSSSLSEAASSYTQSIQTPRTSTPPRQIHIGGGISSSSLSQIPGSRIFGIPSIGSSLKSETLASPPLSTLNNKPKDLVPLSFLENIRTAKSTQYSLPLSYGPGAISARRAVDEAILKGLTS
jgi:hypothetical protein